jgi:hypothetical protein
MTKSSIYLGIGMGLLLILLERSWYYVANVAILDEVQRTMWKNILFGTAWVVMGNCAIWVSLRSKETWWHSTAIVTGIAVGMIPVHGIIVSMKKQSNSFYGDPVGLRIAKAIAAVVLLLVVTITLALALGGLARIAAKVLFRR